MGAKTADVQIIEGATETSVARLIAVYPILYLAHQYKVGDELPTNDESMVNAWVSAGTAEWREGETPVKPKAKPVTAEPGLVGKAVSSEAENGEDLIGKVPKTASRKKK